jgi:hypothetical protein
MPLDKKWEHFDGGPKAAPGRGGVRVTINRSGMIYLNDKAYDLLGRPEAVELYYCRDYDAIALEPTLARKERNFILRKKQMGWAIYASSFCRHYRIRVATTEEFPRPERTADGHMILSMRSTFTVGERRRKSVVSGQ